MKAKAKKPVKRRAIRKESSEQTEESMKTIGKLEAIKAKLVQQGDGGHESIGAEIVKQIVKSSSPNVGQGSAATTKLVIEVVHVDDDGNEIQPTPEQLEMDRKIIGDHHG